jgi:hypothetical protein
MAATVLAFVPAAAGAQGRGGRRPPPPAPRVSVPHVRGQVVFIGGYFYDPYFGPYPWWTRTAYPYWYYPVYDYRAELRVVAMPKEAAVYVDGFYAGIVDDFDGVFQSLPLAPGGHEVTLYLEGYRTGHWNVYLRAGSTFKLHDTLQRLPVGAMSEPPPVAPPVPPPPAGSYAWPRTPPRDQPVQTARAAPDARGFGTFALHVQPASAEVTIDGEPWVSSDEGRFDLQVSVGSHRVEIAKPGYRPYSAAIDVREGETTTLNVILAKDVRSETD